MQVFCSGTALIQHAVTGVSYEIQSDELSWEAGIYHMRAMGAETLYSAVVSHPKLGDLKWEIWEYPTGVESDKATLVGSHTVVRDFEFGLKATAADQAESQEARVERMVDWFYSQYEDPAERTPYESAEGGYQWIWGGPYDAAEVLWDEFPDEEQEAIDAAVEEIESDGIVEWAPRERPDDYDPPEQWPDPDEVVAEALADLPEQEAGITFGIKAAGTIGVQWTPSTATDEAQVSQLVPELRVAAQQLSSLLAGSNAHKPLSDICNRYAETVESDSVSIDRLYSVGIRLENSSLRIRKAVADGDLPDLPYLAAEAIDSVLALHGVIVGSTIRGRELIDGAKAYARTDFEIAVLRSAAQRFAQAVSATSDVFDEEAREVIHDLNAEIGDGPHPERATKSAVTANRNLILVLGGALASTLLSTIVVPGIAASTPVAAAVEGVTALTNAAWLFFLEHLGTIRHYAAVVGPDLRWLVSLCDLIDHARARLTAGHKKARH
ncbi:hypothetical protein [Terricaulis sp.]|uniref:hypothetical protein n=1 Tax=Terricaulis sp. TaxID=2768686 RepID=UPI0037837DE9